MVDGGAQEMEIVVPLSKSLTVIDNEVRLLLSVTDGTYIMLQQDTVAIVKQTEASRRRASTQKKTIPMYIGKDIDDDWEDDDDMEEK